ncbi:membrane protein containing PAS [Candidatus Magnetobacterium bavaricum]|uniref:Membrane protein containing PAS n=1 Tax=Candidatus Magnetobacterium bavaricum TaxID=29290 RepID=A0A0F3GK02_9BACT|nr:membrane protein containing PAS [Candidatus Magnetobacterium bavaricum]
MVNYYKNILVSFMAILVVFVFIVDGILVMHKRINFYQKMEEQLRSELNTIGIIVEESIATNNLKELNNILSRWFDTHGEVIELRVVNNANTIVLLHTRLKKASMPTQPVAVTHKVKDIATITAILNPNITMPGMKMLLFFIIIGSALTIGVMGTTLWWLLKKRDSEYIEQDKTQTYLHTERLRLYNILNSMEEGICVVNKDCDVEFINSSIEADFGPVQGRKCHVYLFDEPAACPWCNVEEALDGKGIRLEKYSPKSQKTYDIYDTILNYNDDKVERLMVFHDITGLKNTENKIKRHFEVQALTNNILQISMRDLSFSELLNNILKAVLLTPKLSMLSKGCVYVVKDDAPDMLTLVAAHSYSLEQMTRCLNIRFGECLCGKAAATAQTVFAEDVDEQHTIHYEGLVVHGHYCLPIIFQGKVVGVLNVYTSKGQTRDYDTEDMLSAVANVLSSIIVRKKTEAALQEREEHFRSIVHTTNNAIVSIDTNDNVSMWNNGAANIFGYTAEEMIGQPLTRIIPERFRQAHKQGLKLAVDTGVSKTQGKTIEINALKKDGTEFFIELSVARWSARTGMFFTGIIRDITRRKQSAIVLEHTVEKLRKLTGAVTQAMAAAVEAKDPYTAGHQRRVADLSRAIADEMHLPQQQSECVRVAAIIHDIGKLTVPTEILSKPGKLKPHELSLIKEHSQIGHDILKGIEFPYPVAQIILQHHERLNGSGYPNGLTGDDIHIEARIICVADVVEAMANHRPYRAALGVQAALDEIVHGKGTLYDPGVVEACVRVFKDRGFEFKD